MLPHHSTVCTASQPVWTPPRLVEPRAPRRAVFPPSTRSLPQPQIPASGSSQCYPVFLCALWGKAFRTLHNPPQQPQQTKSQRIQNSMRRSHPRNRQQLALHKIRHRISSRQRHPHKHRPRRRPQEASRASIFHAPRAPPNKPRQPRHARGKNHRRHHLQPPRNHKPRRHQERHPQHQHHNPPPPSQRTVTPSQPCLCKPQRRCGNHRGGKSRKMKMHRRQQSNWLLNRHRPPSQPRRHQPSPAHRQINPRHASRNPGKP